ncbi:AaceriADL099Cp [[Ashbya] aceris (nom. inval.)]|nr:AaceriADL099Cp [[Ashbya] aceris (nom. inval.)]
MVLSQEHRDLLDAFQKELEQRRPGDLLQFAANYFNKKLEEERLFVRSQESLALSKGVVLFPGSEGCGANRAAGSPDARKMGEDEDVMFKLPFVEHDPHSRHIYDDTEHGHDSCDPHTSFSREPGAGLFKGGFNVGQETQKEAQTNLDPKAPEVSILKQPNVPRKSGVNSKPLPMNFNAERRTSVSGETLKPDHFSDWTPENYTEKTREQLKGLENAVGKNFLFNKLDSDSKTLVINSLEEKLVSKGQEIIRQGDEGDYFYIVEKGTVDFFLDDRKVNTYGPGSCFGELALMYNSPRAVTAVAATDCVLWALDRLTFRRILLSGSFKKRLLYDDFLKSMPLLKSLSNYDRAKLADALETEYYDAGQQVISEGDVGENFYLIEYGEADVSKRGVGVVHHLKKGDYFGEVALLNDLPRQATVTATTKLKVATLGKSGFQRLLGPVVEVLRLNDPTRADKR